MAATYIWDGGGADNNWSTPANWSPDGAPPSNGTADLQFAGSTRLTPNAQSAYSINSLAFNSGAGAFTLGGSSLTIGGGGITQNSTNTETINNALVLGAAQTWNVNAGSLFLGTSATINNGGFGLTVNTATGTSATFAGGMSGAGGLIKSGAGTLVLNGSSSYAGGTTISAGTIQFGNPGAFGSGTVTLGDANTGASSTTLLATQVMNPFTSAGNGVFQTSFARNVVVSASGTGTVTIGTTTFSGQSPNAYNGTIFSGTFQLNRPTIFQSGNSDYTLVSGVISGNVGTLTITGGRRFEIADANVVNTFTGDLQITGTGTVLQLNGNLATNAIPDGSSVDVGAGTTLKLAKNGSGDVNVNESINALTGSGTVQIHEAVGNAHTLTVGAGNGSGTFSGLITNGPGGGALSIAKAGTGTETFLTANTYTGGTAVNAGKLLVSNTTGSGTGSGAITVANTGTVLGGTGIINAGSNAITVGSGAILLGGDGSAASGKLTVTGNLTMSSGSIIELALGASGAHSTLTRAGGAWTFANNQAFTFLLLGTQIGTYDNIITGLSGDPGGEANWRITNSGFTGSFHYDGAGNIDLTVTAVPEPTTWLAGFLALGTLGYSQRRRLAMVIAAWRAGRRPA